MTETTSLISLNHPFGVQRGSIGKVLPGRELKLDENGEILVRGDSIATAYWQDGEMKPVAAEDGWLRTGDLGEIDEQGNLFFKGRKKNVIVTPEGMNVYPQDLENACERRPESKTAWYCLCRGAAMLCLARCSSCASPGSMRERSWPGRTNRLQSFNTSASGSFGLKKTFRGRPHRSPGRMRFFKWLTARVRGYDSGHRSRGFCGRHRGAGHTSLRWRPVRPHLP